MRSLGARPNEGEASGAIAECDYRVGERVSHPKFGAGVIERIEPLTTDNKVVVMFDRYGSKTLLAKFAKLTKL
jgi:DNA helicase-2/ATP-dependent DNA helicase PcrA